MSDSRRPIELLFAFWLASALTYPGGGHALAEEPAGADATAITYEFEDDLVQGGMVQPGVEVLHVRRGGQRVSLVRARTQFIAELLKSAQDL
jgi:hypothetical protein